MELFTLQTFLFFSFIFLSFRLYFSISNKRTLNKGFKHYPIVGILPDFIKNRRRFLEWSTETLQSCPTNTAFLYRPPKVRTNFENYPKGDKFIFLLEDFLGRGIFNSDGELWKVQRKTASYEFNTKSLRNFVMENVGSEILSRLVPTLSKASKSEQVLDLQDILERFAFDNICKVAFNVDPGCLEGDGTGRSEFMRAFEDAATFSAERFRSVFPFIWKIQKLLNIGSERVLRNSIQIVHEFANDIIRTRMEAKDIVISFILAGRDTTSSALSYFFWLLSSRPDVQKKILKELESIRVRSGKSIGDIYSFDELRDMDYLQAAISEAMRLYPPVPIDTKSCSNDDILPDGTFIGKECIWGENCNEYLPERWLENGIYRPENMFKFPVFHAGPRMCLGKDMAYIQMKSIAASVIERFHVLSLTLRMKDGLHVRVKERCVDVIN
ncbi:hypothetical protein Pint_18462 [Pistacia integerrima]|uniref:Uncharacterized protein n=1 Tax=Pistacia integerrima TaxID=434235 RepID=A0ACC0YYC1_9ROSI|nr:hypothetical protein Pint_18462 [Pistacia integerrima]